MNNKGYASNRTAGSAARTRQRPHKFRRFEKRHRGSTNVIAVSLAFIMAFSMLGANISSIVDLLEAFASNTVKIGNDVYYKTTIDLYDYYTDTEIKDGNSDNNADDGVNRNSIFNTALYESGYTADAGTWGSLAYYPLYLGLQYPGQRSGMGNQMLHNADAYKYSMTVNSEAASGTSAAALGLVDGNLNAGDITQGNGKVVLPYFDEEFLTAPLSSVLSSASVPSTHAKNSVGAHIGTSAFYFRKITSGTDKGYYRYDSAQDRLNSSFISGTGSMPNDLYGHPGFFPLGSGNFGFGAKFTIPFTMSSDGYTILRNDDGTVQTDSNGKAKPGEQIKFTFSGDDDVWVFIDGELILDVGGAHGKVSGEINFANKTVNGTTYKPYAKTNVVKNGTSGDYYGNGSYYNHSNSTGTDGARQTSSDELLSKFNSLGLYDDSSKEHTMTVYYIERGSLESNCRITFNFQISDMLTVKNTVNTDNVNSVLKPKTDEAVAKEAVEYVMATDSGTSNVTSPEAEKDETFIEEEGGNDFIISFSTNSIDDTGNLVSHGSVASKKAKSGDYVVLPRGYKASYPGYYIAGWSTDPPTQKPEDDNRSFVSKPYGPVTGNATLHAVWKKMPVSPLEPPTPPILLYVKSKYPIAYLNYHENLDVKIYGTYSDSYGNNLSDQLMGVFANLTSYVTPSKAYTTNLQVNVYSRYDGYEQEQHPMTTRQADGSYTSTYGKFDSNITYPYTPYISFGDRVIKIHNYEGYYYWNVDSSQHSRLDRYSVSDIGSAPKPNYNGLDTWITNYNALYNSLNTWWSNNKNTEDPVKRQAYLNAVEEYKNLTPKSSTSPGDVQSNFQNACNHTITYAYSTDTATFYIYSASEPTVHANNDYYPLQSGQSNGQPYTVEAYTPAGTPSLPAGESEGGSYWKVTVPKYVVKSDQDDSHPSDPPVTTNMPNNISITVGDDEKFVTAEAADLDPVSGIPDEPCFYFATEKKKHICDDSSYNFTDYKVLWFYSASGAPTVTYTYGGTNNDENSVNVSLTADDVTGYYYAKIPASWEKIVGGSSAGSGNVVITFDGTPLDWSASSLNSYTVPCFFTNYDSGNDGDLDPLNLYTVVSNKKSGWSEPYKIHIWNGPVSTTWVSLPEMATISDGFYYHIPSGQKYLLRDNNESAQTADQNSITKNYSYDIDSNALTELTEAGDATHYAYTAAAKSAAAMTRGRSLVPRAIVPEDENPDDTPATGDETPDATPDDTPADTPDDTPAADPDDIPDDTPAAGDENQPSAIPNDTNAPASGTTPGGQFIGAGNNTTGNDFKKVNDTGFKLFDPKFTELTNGAKDFAIKRTDGNGNYNLMFGQSARFTYQFNRGSAIKIAQTGNSYKFTQTQREEARTANKGNNPTYISRNESGSTGTPFYQRYSTTYKVTDDMTNVELTGLGSNVVNGVGDTDLGYMTSVNTPYILLKNLDDNMPADDGVHLTVEYTNTVRTGDLLLEKKLTDQAYSMLDAKYNDGNGEDTSFYFRVTFSEVFGDSDSDEVVYNGTYYASGIRSSDDGPIAYVSGASGSVTSTGSGETLQQNLIEIKFSEIKAFKENSDNTGASYAVKIENIPVFTKYTVEEIIPSGADYKLKGVKVYNVDHSPAASILNDDGTVEVQTMKNKTYFAKPWEEGKHAIYNTTTGEITTPDDDFIPGENDILVDYFTGEPVHLQGGVLVFESDAYSKTANNFLTVTNDVEGQYLIITKQVDFAYYRTVQGDNDTDNPAGLLTRGGTVGGGVSTANDYNGYEDATKAAQGFLFEIREYASGDITSNNYRVIEEVISFSKSDFDNNVTKKSVIFQINPGKTYTVKERTDWSWKYDLASATVVPAGSAAGTDSGGHNRKITSDTVLVDKFSQPYIYNKTDPYKLRVTQEVEGTTNKLNHTAEVIFTNNKTTDSTKKDIEGDTDVADNSCPVDPHPELMVTGGGDWSQGEGHH